MNINRWMSRQVETVKPRDSIAHARALMERNRTDHLPVVVNGHLAGIITERDLRDSFPDDLEVEEVMTRNVVTLAPTDSMEAAARLMRRERVESVPIVKHGCLVGLVTRSDILDAFVRRDQ
jgi:acetoin utilization protein AcuB